MVGKVKWILFLGIFISMSACNTGGLAQSTAAAPTGGQAVGTSPASVNPGSAQPETPQPAAPSSDAAVQAPTLQLCSLITAQDASDLLESGVQSPQEINQACVYNSLPEGRYRVSVSAAQGLDTQGILDNQILILENAGVKIDQSELEYLQSLEASQDYTAFFEELVADASGSKSVHARLVDDNQNGYWTWFTSPGQAQADLVLARENTLVEVNLVLNETSDEASTLEAARALADLVFQRLPAHFMLPPSG
jgi:hypothetical protein